MMDYHLLIGLYLISTNHICALEEELEDGKVYSILVDHVF